MSSLSSQPGDLCFPQLRCGAHRDWDTLSLSPLCVTGSCHLPAVSAPEHGSTGGNIISLELLSQSAGWNSSFEGPAQSSPAQQWSAAEAEQSRGLAQDICKALCKWRCSLHLQHPHQCSGLSQAAPPGVLPFLLQVSLRYFRELRAGKAQPAEHFMTANDQGSSEAPVLPCQMDLGGMSSLTSFLPWAAPSVSTTVMRAGLMQPLSAAPGPLCFPSLFWLQVNKEYKYNMK